MATNPTIVQMPDVYSEACVDGFQKYVKSFGVLHNATWYFPAPRAGIDIIESMESRRMVHKAGAVSDSERHAHQFYRIGEKDLECLSVVGLNWLLDR